MKSFRTLKAGDQIRVGYRSWVPDEPSLFLGFTGCTEGYSEKVLYGSWKEFAEAECVGSFAALQSKLDAAGLSCQAVFSDLSESDDIFAAYLYNGRWVVGSSADRAKLID